MSTEVATCDAARRARHQPKSMWTRGPVCAFAPRSQPELLIPEVPLDRRPSTAADESTTRACPRDDAVQLCCCPLPSHSLSAQHQAVLCQGSPGPKTRLAAPPKWCRPALHRREAPAVSGARFRLPKQTTPRGAFVLHRTRTRWAPTRSETGPSTPGGVDTHAREAPVLCAPPKRLALE